MKEELPSRLKHQDEAGEKKHLKDILNAVRMTRTGCTTLTEFHLFWHYFFDLLERQWQEPEAAAYLKK
eukprot:7298063-Karenia_brevis.AAC.1